MSKEKILEEIKRNLIKGLEGLIPDKDVNIRPVGVEIDRFEVTVDYCPQVAASDKKKIKDTIVNTLNKYAMHRVTEFIHLSNINTYTRPNGQERMETGLRSVFGDY